MMEGTDDSVGAVFFIGYHGSVSGASSVLSITRFAASQSHPLDVHTQTVDVAQVASWAKGVERTGTRTVRVEAEGPLAVFRSFVGITYITRVAEGR